MRTSCSYVHFTFPKFALRLHKMCHKILENSVRLYHINIFYVKMIIPLL